MIIDYNFFGRGFTGNLFDTGIPTSQLDEVTMGAGIYDELFVSVDTTITDVDEKPTKWKLKTIMDAKFQYDLEAGSIDSDGHTVTSIQIYRRRHVGQEDWLLVGQFDYDLDYNVYSFLDRFTENGVQYEYAIVPVAKDVIGDITISPPVTVNYDGVYISDLQNNYKLEVDFELGEISHNNNMSSSSPLNGRYPIVTLGNQDYQTGTVTFLPLSPEQINSGGSEINGRTEREYREQVLRFLKSGGSKVLRNDNGEMMVIAAHNVSTSSKNGNLVDLSAISFSFTEVGGFDFDTMSKGGLIGTAGKSKYTFDENGNIVWAMSLARNIETKPLVRKYRNSLAEGASL